MSLSLSVSLLSHLSHSFFCLIFVSLSSISSFSFSLLSPLCQSLFCLLCVFFCLCVCRLSLSPRPATTPSSRPPSCLPSLAIHLSVLSMHLVTVSLHVSVSVSQSVFDFLSASVPLSLCLSVYTPPPPQTPFPPAHCFHAPSLLPPLCGRIQLRAALSVAASQTIRPRRNAARLDANRSR